MSKILIIAEHANGQLNPSTAKTLTAAKQMGAASIDIAVFAADPAAVATQAAALDGVSRVLTIANAANANALAAVLAPQVVALAANYTHVLGPSTTFGKDLMPRVAALLDAGMASDVAKVEGKDTFTRPILSGNALSTVQISTPIIAATVRQTEFEPAAPLPSPGTVSSAPAGAVDALGATFDRLDAQKSDRPELTDAKVVVSGGRGMKTGENFKVLEELADLLGAAMGASRAATDAGMVPADWQVGQTGKIVAPNLYFAVAISGAIQHLAGMKGSKTIVAINTDKEAPIAQVADYFLVADLFKAVPELTTAVKAAKG